jgi:hypothetical protein
MLGRIQINQRDVVVVVVAFVHLQKLLATPQNTCYVCKLLAARAGVVG